MRDIPRQVQEVVAVVRQHWNATPRVGIILGSGLGGFVETMEIEASIAYADLPHFPRTSAIGHRGRLVCGTIHGTPLVALQGRLHLYEGHSAQVATLPVRLLRALGADTLLVTNAAGAVNPKYVVGDLMLIEDQINLMFANPLIGVNDDQLGPRFPDMSAPYDAPLMAIATRLARQHDFSLQRGVYVGMLGPTYETRAEYRMARQLGGDAVGMSTVPEVVVARHADMRVLGLTIITNVGSPDAPCQTSGHDVLAAAAAAADKLTKLVGGVVRPLAE